ncbi:MAG TPA: Cu(I)-responsive transcriptional regulator [Gammaproteobacteria bacterium]|nr:Cu(I)-responsive transcriptional regulator [Gammaproteobacteria bacterium]
MNIGKAAREAGLSAKMVRHYEAIGLLPDVPRTAAGYRYYSESQIHTLRFIRRARDLGFTMAQIRTLLSLWQDRGRASANVKKVALAHLDELDSKIAQLETMRDTLAHLADHCQGNQRPDCPILADMAHDGDYPPTVSV